MKIQVDKFEDDYESVFVLPSGFKDKVIVVRETPDDLEVRIGDDQVLKDIQDRFPNPIMWGGKEISKAEYEKRCAKNRRSAQRAVASKRRKRPCRTYKPAKGHVKCMSCKAAPCVCELEPKGD